MCIRVWLPSNNLVNYTCNFIRMRFGLKNVMEGISRATSFSPSSLLWMLDLIQHDGFPALWILALRQYPQEQSQTLLKNVAPSLEGATCGEG